VKRKLSTFSRIFRAGDKKLQKKAEECLLQLSKNLQSASAKLHVAAELWEERDFEKVEELKDEIIELERESDKIKDKLVDNIYSKGAYLPQQTEERFNLVMHMDAVLDAAEEAVRILALSHPERPPEEVEELAEKCWICTDTLQDAIKYLFKDFEKAFDLSRKVDKVREEARDIKFKFFDKLFNEYDYTAKEILQFRIISERMSWVAIKAEITGDFIRALAVRYS
jgi:predicted phosphate transport protein (TIGR00153 family)